MEGEGGDMCLLSSYVILTVWSKIKTEVMNESYRLGVKGVDFYVFR